MIDEAPPAEDGSSRFLEQIALAIQLKTLRASLKAAARLARQFPFRNQSGNEPKSSMTGAFEAVSVWNRANSTESHVSDSNVPHGLVGALHPRRNKIPFVRWHSLDGRQPPRSRARRVSASSHGQKLGGAWSQG